MGKRKQTPVNRVRALTIILPVVILLGIGLVMVYDSSVAEAERLFHNKYYFVMRQSLWVVIGLIAMGIMSRLPIKFIQKIGPFAFCATLLLLLIVLLPGVGSTAQGAQRWIRLGSLPSIQPSELAKLTTVLYLASWLRQKQKLLHFFALIGLLLGLLILQPDLGTAMIIVTTAFLLLFISGVPLPAIGAGVGFGITAIVVLIVSSPYRIMRMQTYFNPTEDKLGRSYHINQALMAFGSGGFFGLGLGRSRQKFQYLPEASTDSIFAVVGEELGFVGCLLVLSIFLFLFIQLFRIAIREEDSYRQLLTVGLGGWLAIQTLLNLGAMVALVPLTGVPLPFLSYGGSSLVVQLATLGIVLRIALTKR